MSAIIRQTRFFAKPRRFFAKPRRFFRIYFRQRAANLSNRRQSRPFLPFFRRAAAFPAARRISRRPHSPPPPHFPPSAFAAARRISHTGHSGESRNPVSCFLSRTFRRQKARRWIPAFAGMTREGEAEFSARCARIKNTPFPRKRESLSPQGETFLQISHGGKSKFRVVGEIVHSPPLESGGRTENPAVCAENSFQIQRIRCFAFHASGFRFFKTRMQSVNRRQLPNAVAVIRRQRQIVIHRFALHGFGECCRPNVRFVFAAAGIAEIAEVAVGVCLSRRPIQMPARSLRKSIRPPAFTGIAAFRYANSRIRELRRIMRSCRPKENTPQQRPPPPRPSRQWRYPAHRFPSVRVRWSFCFRAFRFRSSVSVSSSVQTPSPSSSLKSAGQFAKHWSM